MAQITTKIVDNKDEWEGFLAQRPEANFLHSWYWGVFHQRLGHTVERHGFYDGNMLVGVVQAVVEPARRGRHLVVAGGPIIDWQNSQLITSWVETIRRVAHANNCLFVRVRPQLLDNPQNSQLFKKLGFHKSPMHVTADLTSQLDLTKPDDELRKMMRKGTRYELNRAQKLDIKVEASKDDSYIEEFCQLQMETAKRQNFVPFSKKFLTEQFKTFAEVDKVLLYRSTHQGKLLAMAFVIFYGKEAAYHYGASTELAREFPGAYAIQWQAISEARRRGCTRYNFWGVTEHGQTKHRFHGVSIFKRGFGGEDVAYLPARDLIISPIKYPATFVFETARRKLRHL
ncbi:MAG TPA: peptidoglycan bridge formation glycyltransferase FemA/FemB family protein [Patescibacteria group bacterium]|nr:peptidoglycan bridge formation glycyltransferase FemA/FemB family protein [Patescibacteria group bacterium]